MSDRRRLWLSSWEWECCGEPFTVGDRVTLSTQPPDKERLTEILGPELAKTIDHAESHHEDGELPTVTGRVDAIHGVSLQHTEHRVRRDSQVPSVSFRSGKDVDQREWTVSLLGSASEFVTAREPIPASSTLREVDRVPWPPWRGDTLSGDVHQDPGFSGYLVDIDIHDDSDS